MTKKNQQKGNESKPQSPVPVWVMTVTKYSNGAVNVNNFPQHLQTALGFFFEGIIAVVTHFVMKARAGEVNERCEIEGSKILKPNKKIIHPGDHA